MYLQVKTNIRNRLQGNHHAACGFQLMGQLFLTFLIKRLWNSSLKSPEKSTALTKRANVVVMKKINTNMFQVFVSAGRSGPHPWSRKPRGNTEMTWHNKKGKSSVCRPLKSRQPILLPFINRAVYKPLQLVLEILLGCVITGLYTWNCHRM